MTTTKPLKPRKCAACPRKFTPRTGLQRACSPVCALAFARDRKAKKERRARVANTRAAKEAIKTKPQLLAEAQKAFNAFIRERDEGLPCISCGRGDSSAKLLTGSMFHAGHYRSVGACPELRFDEFNVHAQCAHCNKYKSGNVVDYRINLIKRIGLRQVEILEGPHLALNLTRDQIRHIRDTYRAKRRELLRGRAA